MSTFVDLYFAPGSPVERDDIQAAIEADLGSRVDVVGAGVGEAGSNLDLELNDDEIGPVLAALAQTLTRLGVPDETLVAISNPTEKISLADLRRRWPLT